MEMDPLAAVLPQFALEEALAERGGGDEVDESAASTHERATAESDDGEAAGPDDRQKPL